MNEWERANGAPIELKRSVRERLIKARRSGLTVGDVERVSERQVMAHDVFDMLDAKFVKKQVWEQMDQILKDFGY